MQPQLPQTGGQQQPDQTPQSEPQSFYTPPTPPAFQPAESFAAPVNPPPQSPAPIQAPTPMPQAQPAMQAQPTAPAQADGVVSWQASEFIHRSKGAAWTGAFGLITLAFLGGAIWLQAWLLVVLVVVMAIAIGYVSFRQPRVQQYTLTHDGLQINNQLYNFGDFRAFGVVPEDAFFSVQLIPIKRFMPAVTVYFAENDGERIVDILGEHLPMEQIKPDVIDRAMARLRF